MRYWSAIILIILIFFKTQLSAQVNDSQNQKKISSLLGYDSLKKKGLLIKDITVKGVKQTKPYVILREMSLKKGEIIPESDLEKEILISRNQVFNTSLFLDVSIVISSKTTEAVSLTVEVKERWYIFPVPYFRLADRNFNQWWKTENHDLNRVNYGIKITDFNLTGNNDEMDVWLINGYTKQISLRYNLPFFDKSLKQGLNIGYVYSTQKQLNDSTSLNQQVFVSNTDFVRSLNRADITYTYRPNQKWKHYVKLSYGKEWIADTVLKSNPYYFPGNRNYVTYPDIMYSFRYLDLDYLAYPTKGYYFDGYIYKRGLDTVTNLWQVGVNGLYAHPLWKNGFIRLSASIIAKSPSNRYFFNQKLFGYGDFYLRGLEYYVIDGDAGALAKATLLQRIYKSALHTYLKGNNYSKIPFSYFLKVYADVGYAHNSYPGNSMLNNKLLYSGGVGIDFVSIYDLVVRVEFSFNQLGGRDVYLHAR